MGRVFVGHDWAEAHHDVFIADDTGREVTSARLEEGVSGVARFHEIVAGLVDDPGEVLVASETDRGLFISALVAAGYRVIAVNPIATSRYRERLSTSGAKSDAGDGRVLSDIARLDGHNHRPIAGDSDLAEAVKVLARAHQNLIWSRQRNTNQRACQDLCVRWLVHVAGGIRPGKVMANALSACFQPCVLVPNGPPLVVPMLRMAR